MSIRSRIRFDRNKLARVATEVGDVLDAACIPYCAMYGTVLGHVRDKDIIAWDHDVDLAILARDYSAFVDLFNGPLSSFEVVRLQPANDDRTVLDTEYPPDGCTVHYSKACCLLKDNQLIDISFQVWLPPTCTYESTRGLRLRFPVHPHRYLDDVYGHGWQTPNPKATTIRSVHRTETRLMCAAPWLDGPYHRFVSQNIK